VHALSALPAPSWRRYSIPYVEGFHADVEAEFPTVRRPADLHTTSRSASQQQLSSAARALVPQLGLINSCSSAQRLEMDAPLPHDRDPCVVLTGIEGICAVQCGGRREGD
jgi:hypothetical protein